MGKLNSLLKQEEYIIQIKIVKKMEEKLIINADEITSTDLNTNQIISKNIEITESANLLTITAEIIKLKQQVELLNSELKIVSGYKEIARFSESKVEINTHLYNNDVLISVPIGTIVAFVGEIIPNGWILCDGKNNTPNLVKKFLRGNNSAKGEGGNERMKLEVDHLPPHKHSITHISTAKTPNFDLTGWVKDEKDPTGVYATDRYNNGNPIKLLERDTLLNKTGKGDSFSILPPYYDVLYIMKIK